jgi:hypothetical protein
MTGARGATRRFATSSFAIYLTGEVGAGRRTLAAAIARHRFAGRTSMEVEAGRGLPAARPPVLLLHHPKLIVASDQVKLAVGSGAAPGSSRGAAPTTPLLCTLRRRRSLPPRVHRGRVAPLGRNRARTAKALGVDARTVFRYLETKADE